MGGDLGDRHRAAAQVERLLVLGAEVAEGVAPVAMTCDMRSSAMVGRVRPLLTVKGRTSRPAASSSQGPSPAAVTFKASTPRVRRSAAGER